MQHETMTAERFARYLLALLVIASALYAWARTPRPRLERAVAWLVTLWVVVGWLLLVPLAFYLIGGRAP